MRSLSSLTISIWPRNSGRYFSTGSSNFTLPSSTSIINAVAGDRLGHGSDPEQAVGLHRLLRGNVHIADRSRLSTLSFEATMVTAPANEWLSTNGCRAAAIDWAGFGFASVPSPGRRPSSGPRGRKGPIACRATFSSCNSQGVNRHWPIAASPACGPRSVIHYRQGRSALLVYHGERILPVGAAVASVGAAVVLPHPQIRGGSATASPTGKVDFTVDFRFLTGRLTNRISPMKIQFSACRRKFPLNVRTVFSQVPKCHKILAPTTPAGSLWPAELGIHCTDGRRLDRASITAGEGVLLCPVRPHPGPAAAKHHQVLPAAGCR